MTTETPTTAGPIVEPEPFRTVPDPLEPEPQPIQPTMYGWQCPKCGQVYAPFVSKCDTCVVRTTTSNTTTIQWSAT